MNFVRNLLLAFLSVVVTSSSPLSDGGIRGRSQLRITPGGTQVKAVGSRLVFTCALIEPSDSPASGPEEVFDLQWKGPDSKYITSPRGRVYTERIDEHRLRLYITEVAEDDAGTYSCEATVKGAFLTAYSQLNLFEDISFVNGTSAQIQERIGSDVLLPCVADGKPEPEMSWRFRGRKLTSDEKRDKHVYEKNGLWIRNITREDNGTYECRAQVVTQGNLKVRHISLNVLYPPMLRFPVKSPLALRGSDVTLECLADGNPPVTHHWFKEQQTAKGIREEPLEVEAFDGKNDLSVSDDSAGKFKIHAIDLSDEGRYICRVSNALGALRAAYDVKVLVAPVITAPKQLPVLEGKSIVLPCEASGIPLPSLTWMKKGDSTMPESLSHLIDKDISVNTTVAGISRLIIQGVDRKRHSGNYTCMASNSAGFDSKDIDVIVETLPVTSISHVTLVGWKGQRRTVTCLATGLPLPTISWTHNGNDVADNHVTRITTIHDAETVTSVLEIELIDDLDFLFGNYSCLAKNIHGHSTKTFQLRRAPTPAAPRNVTVTSATFNSISLSVDSGTSSVPDPAALRPIKWILKYQRTSDDDSLETKIHLLYEEGSDIVVGNLDPDTTYTMYLSVANDAGIGSAVKFQAKTLPAPENKDKYVTREDENGEFQGDDSRSGEGAVGGGESLVMDKDIAFDRSLLADWGGIFIGLIIGIAVMLAILVVTVSGAIVRTQRSMTARRAVMTVVKTKGRTETGGTTATTIKVSECKDIDSLKVETNRPKTSVGPIPGDRFGSLGSKKNVRVTQGPTGSTSTVASSASPVMPRSTGSGSPEMGTPRSVGQGDGPASAQSQAWQNMLLKAEAQARDEELLQQLEAEAVIVEFPHPPLEMLLQSGQDLEGQTKAGDEEEDYDDDDVSGTKNGEVASDETLSLNSEDECFQKVPQFEGKSFLQY